MIKLIIISLVFISLIYAQKASDYCPNFNPKLKLKSEKYVGTWYVAAETRQCGKKGPSKCPKMKFTLDPKNLVFKVTRTEIDESNTRREREGLGSGNLTAKVEIKYNSTNGVEIDHHWVLRIFHTRFSVVYTCDLINSTKVEKFAIFTRDPGYLKTPKNYEKTLEFYKMNKLNYSSLEMTDQLNCVA